MSLHRLACLVAVSLLLAAAAFAPTLSRGGSDALRPAVERQRIHSHLLGAERALRAADVSHLSEAQRERRSRAIALLREYRRAGIFPHNHDFPDERRPYFVDRHGTLCAMAYLIAHTGGEQLVERVARSANNAYVAELAADPAFDAWLDRHGMTEAEAARIQPMYGCCYVEPANEDPDAGYALATAGNAALSGATVAAQLTGDAAPGAWWNVLGLATGGAGIWLGVAGLDGTAGDRTLAALNFGTGAATLGTVAWRLLRSGDAPPPPVGEDAGPGLSWTAQPVLSGGGGAGVHLTLRF